MGCIVGQRVFLPEPRHGCGLFRNAATHPGSEVTRTGRATGCVALSCPAHCPLPSASALYPLPSAKAIDPQRAVSSDNSNRAPPLVTLSHCPWAEPRLAEHLGSRWPWAHSPSPPEWHTEEAHSAPHILSPPRRLPEGPHRPELGRQTVPGPAQPAPAGRGTRPPSGGGSVQGSRGRERLTRGVSAGTAQTRTPRTAFGPHSGAKPLRAGRRAATIGRSSVVHT